MIKNEYFKTLFELKKALAKYFNNKYDGIIYCYDKVILFDELTLDVNLDNIIDIVVFDGNVELHYYKENNELALNITKTIDFKNDKYIDEVMQINPNIKKNACLKVRNYLDYTNDGIIHVKKAMLMGVECNE